MAGSGKRALPGSRALESLQAWQLAEKSVGDGSEAPLVDGLLPMDRKLLLRTMDVLERGNRAEVKALRDQLEEAGEYELSTFLDVLLAPARSLEPTAIRSDAKQMGIGQELGFPYLDLLRLMAAWRRAGMSAKASPRLSRAAKSNNRPALAAAVDALKGIRPKSSPWQDLLETRFPRALLIWQALKYKQGIDQDFQVLSKLEPPDPRDFPRSRWLELYADDWLVALSGWVGNPITNPFSHEWRSALKGLYRLSPREQAMWLGRILDAISAELEKGRAQQAWFLVLVARELAGGIPQQSEVLHEQLRELEFHLRRFSTRGQEDEHVEALEILWQRSVDLAAGERAVLARAIMDHQAWKNDALDPDVRQGVLLELITLDSSHLAPRLKMLRAYGDELDPVRLTAALSPDVPPLERHHLLGLSRAIHGDLIQALHIVLELAGMEQGQGTAIEILKECVLRADRMSSAGIRRLLDRIANELSKNPSEPFPLLDLLITVQDRWGGATRTRWVRTFKEPLQASTRFPARQPRRMAALVVAGIVAGSKSTSDGILRDWARVLRRAEDPCTANRQVLIVLAWMLGLSRALGIDRHLADWVGRLVLYMRRRPQGEIAGLVDPFLYEHRCYLAGLALLHDRYGARLGHDAAWTLVRALVCMERGQEERAQVLLNRAVEKLGPRSPLIQRFLARQLVWGSEDRESC